MGLAGDISRILAEAERQLKGLAVEALARRDYEAAGLIAAVANRVATADEAMDGSNGVPPMPPAAATSKSASEGGSKPLVAVAKEFPRFHRDRDNLVKTGFSKSDRKIYQHRCPREVLDRLAAEIGQLASDGRGFTTEQLVSAEGGQLAGIPAYQIYLSLGFLLKRGIVRRNGRSEYVVSDGRVSELAAAVHREWNALQNGSGAQ